jgi:hypothetical protein
MLLNDKLLLNVDKFPDKVAFLFLNENGKDI